MNIRVRCNACRQSLRVQARLANQVVTCPECEADITVPRLFRNRSVNCACGTRLTVPIEDANCEIACPQCSRVCAPLGLDTFLDSSAPAFMPQKDGLLSFGKVIDMSKAEYRAQRIEEETSRKRHEEEARIASERRRKMNDEEETKGIRPPALAAHKDRVAQGLRWCIASWGHVAIVAHGMLAAVLYAAVIVRHLILTLAGHRELFSPPLRWEIVRCAMMAVVLIALAAVWYLVATFLYRMFENKALAARARRRRIRYPYLNAATSLLESVLNALLYLGLFGAMLTQVVGSFSATMLMEHSWEWEFLAAPWGLLIVVTASIASVTLTYLFSMALLELVFILVDIERNTSAAEEPAPESGESAAQLPPEPAQTAAK